MTSEMLIGIDVAKDELLVDSEQRSNIERPSMTG